MATHTSIVAWRIPWTVESGGVAKTRTRLKQLNMALTEEVLSFSFDQSRNKCKEIRRFSPDDPAPKSWICTQAYLTPSECFLLPGVLH